MVKSLKHATYLDLFIYIKDGYFLGDTLYLDSSLPLSYNWDEQSKVLSIKMINDKDISNIVSAVKLEGSMQDKSRYLEVKTVLDNQEHLLQDYSIYPNYDINIEENSNLFENNYSDDLDLSVNLPNIIYSDVQNGDFLNTDTVESFPYFLNKTDNHDIYTILKDDAHSNHKIEIWGYNVHQDKIDLNNFADDLKDVQYQILNNYDLQLNISNTEAEYNIILKDAASFDSTSTLDDIVQNLVLNIEINKYS